MTWQEFSKQAIADLGNAPTREQWRAAVDRATAMLDQVDEADRLAARGIIGDTLIQTGAFLGYLEP